MFLFHDSDNKTKKKKFELTCVDTIGYILYKHSSDKLNLRHDIVVSFVFMFGHGAS